MNKTLPVLIFSCVFSAAAQASADGNLWIGPVAMLCLVQDDSNLKTPVGKMLSDLPEYQQMRAQGGAAVTSCIVKQHPVPTPLCTELLSRLDSSKAEQDELQRKYADKIEAIFKNLTCAEKK